MIVNAENKKHLILKITTAQNTVTKSLGKEKADRCLYYTASVTCAFLPNTQKMSCWSVPLMLTVQSRKDGEVNVFHS
jgi:hypothetical protein